MARLAFLLFISISVYADFFWGGCPTTSVVKSFDEDLYLGKWLEMARTKVPYTTTNKCNRAFYDRKEDGTIGAVNSALEDYGYRHVFAEAYCESSGTGQCYVSFSKWAPWSDYQVLSVDYDKYTVIFSCLSFGIFHAEFAWILSRDYNYDWESVVSVLED